MKGVKRLGMMEKIYSLVGEAGRGDSDESDKDGQSEHADGSLDAGVSLWGGPSLRVLL